MIISDQNILLMPSACDVNLLTFCVCIHLIMCLRARACMCLYALMHFCIYVSACVRFQFWTKIACTKFQTVHACLSGCMLCSMSFLFFHSSHALHRTSPWMRGAILIEFSLDSHVVHPLLLRKEPEIRDFSHILNISHVFFTTD